MPLLRSWSASTAHLAINMALLTELLASLPTSWPWHRQADASENMAESVHLALRRLQKEQNIQPLRYEVRVRAGLVLAICFAIPYVAPGAEASAWSLRWNTNSNQITVEVVGLGEKTLRQIQGANWQAKDWRQLFSVYAGQGDILADLTVPAMLGSYCIEDGLIRFQPKFPLERGVTYRAVFRPGRLPGGTDRTPEAVSLFDLPRAKHGSNTVVTRIYPSGNVLPENLLKFYVHFSAPMRRGHIYEHIHLLNQAGKPVELPFLEIDEELWNPEMTRLTLFIDPGRIKRGVQPLEEIGPALESGKNYTLVIDRGWQDAEGNPLKESYRKPFKAGPADRGPIVTAAWKIIPPPAGSLGAVQLRLPDPLDHALAQRMIRVTDTDGHLVAGETSLSDSEHQWSFAPSKAWTAGPYRIVVQTALEDLAGNNIGKPFEVDLFDGVQRRVGNETVSLAFEVK